MDASAVLKLLSQNREVIIPLIKWAVGVIVGICIWRQRSNLYWLTHRKDLYDRRKGIRDEVEKILILMFRNRKVSSEDLSMLLSNTAEAKNLFGPEIPEYINEVDSRGRILRRATDEYRHRYQGPPPPDYDHNKIVRDRSEQSRWAWEEHKKLDDKFNKYLHISK